MLAAMYDPLPFTLPLATRRMGRPLYFLGEVDSTNRVMREMAASGASEGTVVLTDYQAGGRGRLGRSWSAPRGTSLLFSALLRPTLPQERLSLLPIVVAVALARMLENHLNLNPAIKWPNDILLDGAKCCGILIESERSVEWGWGIVVGIGLNVNQEAADLESLPGATSLRLACGEPVERGPLLAALLGELERAYDDFQAGWQPHEAWRKRAPLLGQPIQVYPSDGEGWPATAVDLAGDGSLIVSRSGGEREHLHAGDVSVRAQP